MSTYDWFQNTCKTKVGDIVAGKPCLLSVDSRATLGSVLDVMATSHATTVGVYGEAGHWLGDQQLVVGSKQYIGMVSILDVVAFLASGGSVEARLQSPVSEVIGATAETQSVWVEPLSRPLFFAMEQFCRGTHHAFAVDDRHVEEPRMLAQSDIVNFLLQHEDALPHAASTFAAPIGSLASEVSVFVSPDTPLKSAFQLMLLHHAVPVMSGGRIVATLSASDLRGHLSTMVAFVAPMTVMDYILYRNGDDVPAPFALPRSTPLGVACREMLSRGMHRCWLQPEEEAGEGEGEGDAHHHRRARDGHHHHHSHGSSSSSARPAAVLSLTDAIRAVFLSGLPAGAPST
jgi:CBS domain-containing protein